MTGTPASVPNTSDRNMAMVNYGLLFSSVFFAGVPGLIAVIIAYAQRDQADRQVRSHYDFQVRIFWIAFILAIVGAACFLAALIMGVGELIQFGAEGGWDAWDGATLDFSDITIDGSLVLMMVTSAISLTLAGVWMLAAPAFGFIRLASERRIGQQAA